MSWVVTSKTKSGYGVVVDAPGDLLETAHIKKEVIEQTIMPEGSGWLPDQMSSVECLEEDYVESDYVEDGYTEGSVSTNVYMESDYADSDYVEGECEESIVTSWARWVADPVGIPYEFGSDMFNDISDVFPFGDITAAVLAGDNISALFGLAMPADKRKEKGLRALQEGEE